MIVNRIHAWATTQPTRPAVVSNGDVLGYADFSRAIDLTRRVFEPLALPVGRTAIVLVEDRLGGWLTILALRALGLTTIAVQSLAQAVDLGLKDVACVVVTEAERTRHALDAPALAGVPVLVAPSTIRAAARSGELPRPRDDAWPFGGHILYTSGTTGAYKKLLEDGRLEDRRNQARAELHRMHAGTVHQSFQLGLWTAVGFKSPPSVWHVGGCVVLETRPDGYGRFFDHGVNRAFCLPGMLPHMLDAHAASRRRDVEIVVSGGFLPLEMAGRIVRELTDTVSVTYGSTELYGGVMSARFRGDDDLRWMTPSPGRTLQIVGEDGQECGVGEEGELRVLRTEVDASAYLDDPETSARVFRNGFFHPGDMAVRRADGRIRVLGRTADVLNAGGHKIAAAPIEQEIQRLLGVDEVCLFAGLNAEGQDELVIAIQSDRAPDRPALEAIGRHFSMFQVVRFAILRAFPRTETGTRKTRRLALRQMVWTDAKPI